MESKTNERFKKALRGKSINVTFHFLKRWNERVGKPEFKNVNDLEIYITDLFMNREVVFIEKNLCLVDETLIRMVIESDDISLLTTYGTYENNPIFFNILYSEGMKGIARAIKKYGKLDLSYSSTA